jgi:methyl-accepting chemotaxis protein
LHVRGWTFSLTLAALAAGLVLTVIMTRSLLRQLGGEPAYAQEVAARIAQGEFNYDIHLQAGDSHSLLAVINLMRNRLNLRSQALEKTNQEMAEVIQT